MCCIGMRGCMTVCTIRQSSWHEAYIQRRFARIWQAILLIKFVSVANSITAIRLRETQQLNNRKARASIAVFCHCGI